MNECKRKIREVKESRREKEKEWQNMKKYFCSFQIFRTFYYVTFLRDIKHSGQFSRLTHFKYIYELINLHKFLWVFCYFLSGPSISFMPLAFCPAVASEKTLQSWVSLEDQLTSWPSFQQDSFTGSLFAHISLYRFTLSTFQWLNHVKFTGSSKIRLFFSQEFEIIIHLKRDADYQSKTELQLQSKD